MATRTIAERLLIKPGTTVWASHLAHLDRVGPLPEGVSCADGPDGATTALVFADGEGSLRDTLAEHGDRLVGAGAVWVAYPKANRADINRDTLWPILGEYGLRPIGQVAVDDVWSAMRFRPLKEGEEPFTGGR